VLQALGGAGLLLTRLPCRLRLTNGGYKELLEAIKRLKAGAASKGDTVDLAHRVFAEGGCDDLFSASRP